MLSKEVSSTIFKVFGMTPHGTEPGNLRIKVALLIAKLHPRIISRLELNTDYIIN